MWIPRFLDSPIHGCHLWPSLAVEPRGGVGNLPEADPGIYLTMSLSITFPFNVLINIGLISAFASMIAGQGGLAP